MSENHTDVEANTEGVEFLDSKEGAGDTQNDLVTTNNAIEQQRQNDNVEREKNLETVIDMLSEKQTVPVVTGPTKQFWVCFSERPQRRRGRRGSHYSDDYDGYDDHYVRYEPGRNSFVRKVFAIAFFMLSLTAGSVAAIYIFRPPFVFHPYVPYFIIGCVAMAVIISCAFACCDCAMYPPVNWILFLLAVCAYTAMCSIICLRYAPFIILAAVVSTAAVTGLCLGLAYTSIDFTKCYLIVGAAIFAVFIAGIVCVVLSKVFGYSLSTTRLVIAILASALSAIDFYYVLRVVDRFVSIVCGGIISALFIETNRNTNNMLIIEFQMILGGKSVELTEDMYVYGAYLIYSSIVSLFLKLLFILGETVGK